MRMSKNLRQKFGLHFFSLILAVFSWIYIHDIVQGGLQAYKDLRGVQIKLMGEALFLGTNVFTVDMEKHTISLRVKGPEREIEKLTKEDVVAYVDISGLRPGRTYSPVVNFILPPGIEMVGVPPLVRVEIKEKNL